ncbi:similar to Saccharomyces cerevisiae YMR034C Putative transporter, member of the SLC10 carrier family [Maudiozyma saulgeensis]|uniref:Similar to Saccharomyces cerevisiae YMR034C Putative transporter, member of the SLC10 carrier family n=1 Tax=Maudiozyma saulgeensis TaxID=1789683 RepID=A0A1X7R7W8_9SACH|nr:similar to Saccharomyces cerevisiae YMR034C Putative transporter, member of the SLC10 carrier family [Kazachstania saulgeensis]
MTFSNIKFKKVWNHPVTNIIKSFWFFYCLAVFIVIARFAPNFARDGGLIKAEYSIGYGAVAWIFLQSGLSMETKRILANISNWRAHLTVATMSFLITSSIVYGFCVAIIKSNDKNIDNWVLMGIITTITCPTTVASNVIMTHDANGNDLLCVCEVVLGNLFGAFITPALVQMYTSNDLFAFGNPSRGGSISALYGRVMKQVGLSVFVPLFVGQCIQNIFPKQTSAYLSFLKRYNIKIGSYMLLLIMFSSFSTAFYQKSFTSVSHICIVFVCFFNLGVYLFFTMVSFCLARPFFILKLFPEEPIKGKCSKLYYYSYKIFRPFYYNKKDTICIMFCAPAKTAALGVSLITSQYGDHKEHLGKLLVPLVLYQGEQVLTASIFVPILRRWVKEELEEDKLREQEERDDEKTLSGCSDLVKLPTTDIERQTVSSSESSIP